MRQFQAKNNATRRKGRAGGLNHGQTPAAHAKGVLVVVVAVGLISMVEEQYRRSPSRTRGETVAAHRRYRGMLR
jgi:hypothetical protein